MDKLKLPVELDHSEGYAPYLAIDAPIYEDLDDEDASNRLCLVAVNEGGYNTTWIDLFDLIEWYNNNKEKVDEFVRKQTNKHSTGKSRSI